MSGGRSIWAAFVQGNTNPALSGDRLHKDSATQVARSLKNDSTGLHAAQSVLLAAVLSMLCPAVRWHVNRLAVHSLSCMISTATPQPSQPPTPQAPCTRP